MLENKIIKIKSLIFQYYYVLFKEIYLNQYNLNLSNYKNILHPNLQ